MNHCVCCVMAKSLYRMVTVTLAFDHQILISLSLSLSGCLCQICRNSLKVLR